MGDDKMVLTIILIVCGIILLFMIFLFVIVYHYFNVFFTTKHLKKETLLNWPQGTQYTKYQDIIDTYHHLIDTLDSEEVKIKSYDGFDLYGNFYPNEKKNKVIIFFHGYLSCYRNDCGSFEEYYKRGYSILLVDQRAHGRSGGKYITFGIKESNDVLSWCNYLTQKFGNDIEILLGGVSLGSSTVMMSSNLNLPKQVKGIIGDCGFDSCKQILKDVMKAKHVPFVNLVLFIINIYFHMFMKIGINDKSSSKSLSESNIPILIIHGRGDDFVPYYTSEVCFEKANTKIKLFYPTDSFAHGASYFDNKEEYVDKVLEFLNLINY